MSEKALFWIALALSVIAPAAIGAEGVVCSLKAGEELRAWHVLSTRKVLPNEALPEASPVGGIEIAGAKGEYVAFQLVIRPSARMENAGVRFGDLASGERKIARDNMKASAVGYVTVTQKSGKRSLGKDRPIPDVLLPTTDLTFEPGANNIIWVTVFVPLDAAAGDYSGVVQLVRREEELAQFPIRLHVWDFALPAEMPLTILANVWPNEEWFGRYGRRDFSEVLKEYYRSLSAHRINATASVYPLDKPWAPGQIPQNLAAYDEMLHFVLDELKFTRFRFPFVGGAGGGIWQGIKVFDFAPPVGCIWVNASDFVSSHVAAAGDRRWRRQAGAVCLQTVGSGDGNPYNGSWVEYDVEIADAGEYRVYIQGEAIQETEIKEVLIEGQTTGEVTGVEIAKHARGFARLPRSMKLSEGKIRVRVIARRITGTSDPLYSIVLCNNEEAPPEEIEEKTVSLSREFRSRFGYHVLEALKHFREKGWEEKIQLKLWDEPTAPGYLRLRLLYHLARELAPTAKLELSEEPSPYLVGTANVWTPYATHFDPAACAQRRAAGEEVWIYWNLLHGVDYPGLDMRLIPWMLWKYRLDGYILWSVNYWKDDPWMTPSTFDSDCFRRGTFLYPDPKTGSPINSIRWELFRDGLEDYQYLYLLRRLAEQAGKKGKNAAAMAATSLLAQTVDSLVTDLEHYSDDDAALEDARVAIAKEIETLQRIVND